MILRALRLVAVLLAVLTIGVTGPVALRHWRERPPEPPSALRGAWVPPAGVDVGASLTHPFELALSPDGRRLAFPGAQSGRSVLWLQDLGSGKAGEVPGTDGAAMPFWSPDGTRVGFFAGGRIRAFDLASGLASDLAESTAGCGAAWNAAGDLVFASSAAGPLVRRTPAGAVATLTALDTAARETAHCWPAFLPDGRHLVYLARTSVGRTTAWLASLDAAGPRLELTATEAQPLVVGDTLVFASGEALMAQPLDQKTWAPVGRPSLVGLPVGHGPLGQLFATAARDALIFGAPGTTLRELQWRTRTGVAAGRMGEPVDAWDLRIGPDGRRVAVTERDTQVGTLDIWIHDGSQPVPLRLSRGTDIDEGAVWSPQGTRLAWTAARRAVTIRGAGAVLDEQTVGAFDPPVRVWDWSRDGRWLVVGRRDAVTGDDLWIVAPDDGGEARPYVRAPFNEIDAVVSPDGRHMAYASNESGQFDVFVDSFPTPGTRIRVTTAGGREPRWRRDGGELFFRRGSEIHAVAIDRAGDRVTARATERLFDAGADVRTYDASADGSRFLLNVPAASAAPRAATLVVNWRGR